MVHSWRERQHLHFCTSIHLHFSVYMHILWCMCSYSELCCVGFPHAVHSCGSPQWHESLHSRWGHPLPIVHAVVLGGCSMLYTWCWSHLKQEQLFQNWPRVCALVECVLGTIFMWKISRILCLGYLCNFEEIVKEATCMLCRLLYRSNKLVKYLIVVLEANIPLHSLKHITYCTYILCNTQIVAAINHTPRYLGRGSCICI